jgi:hypothetical protein
LHETFIRDAIGGRETVAIVGRAKQENYESVQIILEVDAREDIRFAVENLDVVKIMRDGLPLVGSPSQSGTFQVAITGCPKNDT